MLRLLLYCTRKKPYLTRNDLPNEKGDFYKHWQLGGELDKKHLYGDTPILNGKIVAECDFEVEEIREAGDEFEYYCYTENLLESELLKKSCLTEGQLYGYLENGTGYAIHIKNLNIFDKPRELQNYVKKAKNGTYWMLDKAPQNMMVCYKQNKEKYILISVRPEYLVKILNGEKTIEVRKKVLKEMVK